MKWDVGFLPPKRKFEYEESHRKWTPVIKVGAFHTDSISRVKFSPNGRLLASVSCDGSVSIFDLVSEKRIGSALIHDKGINDATWDASGRHIYTASSDGRSLCIAIHQLPALDIPITNDEILQKKNASYIIGNVIHHFESAVKNNPNSCIPLKESLEPNDGYNKLYEAVTCVESPNFTGQYFMTGGYDELFRKWDIRNFKCVSDVRAHDSPLSSIDISTDDRVLLTTGLDGQIRLWSADDLVPMRTYTGNNGIPISHASFSSNGQYILAIPMESDCRLWSIPTPKKFLNLVAPSSTESAQVVEKCFSAESSNWNSSDDDDAFKPITRSCNNWLIGDTATEFVTAPNAFGTIQGDFAFVPEIPQYLEQSKRWSGVNIWKIANGKYAGHLSCTAHRQAEITTVCSHPNSLIATSGGHPDNSIVVWLPSE